VPRLLPDGQRNALHLERLKDKLGNRSNASSEVEFVEACGWLVGEEGDGVRQILKMGGLTRFDCALGSHALMRRAYSVALYHALQRQAFGKNLVDQPMMRQVLGQMALRLEGQTAFLFRLARAWDSRDDAREVLWARLFTPAAKFAICKSGIRSSLRRWRCWAGLATVKRASCRACIVRCRSIVSGKAQAISCVWT
jgi:putative acyl-CoA dehydrogenase